ADDEFDLSLDELEAGLDADLQADAAQHGTNPASHFDFSKPAADPARDDLDFDLTLGDEAQGDDLADFSLDLDEGSKSTAVDDDDFLLSLEDEPSPKSRNELDDLSLELSTDSAAAEFDLSSDFDLSLADEAPAPAPTADSFAAQLDEVSAELDQLSESMDLPDELDAFDLPPAAASTALATEQGDEDDFDFLSGTDETATKLDLARAYIDMGDTEGARDILDEVINEGSDGQQSEARELLARLV
ncbi:MAG TPA: FimV/HubP family polar landmark protein, partial [Pseudomonas sp.]|nr:FimV/HubP family polar landmark protein [Pseudomonas sp.]